VHLNYCLLLKSIALTLVEVSHGKLRLLDAYWPVTEVDCGLKCDGTRAKTRFRLLATWTSSFKSAGASVQSTTDSRGVRISGSNAGYTLFRGRVKGPCHPLHSPVSPSLLLPCVTVCQHISSGLYFRWRKNTEPKYRRVLRTRVNFTARQRIFCCVISGHSCTVN